MDALTRLPAALDAVAPRVDAATWSAALAPVMRSSGLVTPRRAAMFLGQCAEESGGFTDLVEDLNYSAAALCREWPSHFAPTPLMPDAADYARDPERIADYVYSAACHPALGNGPPASGDGWRFRGAGIIQLTGRTYWTRFGASVGRGPEDAWAWSQTVEGACAAACWYWLDRGQLLALSDAWDIAAVTERINGGLTNLPTRIVACTAALAAFGDAVPAPAAPAAGEDSADALMAQEQAGRVFPTT